MSNFRGKLTVFVHRGEKLHDTAVVGKIDPYCVVRIPGGAKYKTRVAHNAGVNPVWEDTFVFDLAGTEGDNIVFELWDDETVSDDRIGSCEVPLRDFVHRPLPNWYRVDRNKKGDALGGLVLVSNKFEGELPQDLRPPPAFTPAQIAAAPPPPQPPAGLHILPAENIRIPPPAPPPAAEVAIKLSAAPAPQVIAAPPTGGVPLKAAHVHLPCSFLVYPRGQAANPALRLHQFPYRTWNGEVYVLSAPGGPNKFLHTHAQTRVAHGSDYMSYVTWGGGRWNASITPDGKFYHVEEGASNGHADRVMHFLGANGEELVAEIDPSPRDGNFRIKHVREGHAHHEGHVSDCISLLDWNSRPTMVRFPGGATTLSITYEDSKEEVRSEVAFYKTWNGENWQFSLIGGRFYHVRQDAPTGHFDTAIQYQTANKERWMGHLIGNKPAFNLKHVPENAADGGVSDCINYRDWNGHDMWAYPRGGTHCFRVVNKTTGAEGDADEITYQTWSGEKWAATIVNGNFYHVQKDQPFGHAAPILQYSTPSGAHYTAHIQKP